jgi:hypothetical protein
MSQRHGGRENEAAAAGNYMPRALDPARAAALVDLSQMLLDSNEFLYIQTKGDDAMADPCMIRAQQAEASLERLQPARVLHAGG